MSKINVQLDADTEAAARRFFEALGVPFAEGETTVSKLEVAIPKLELVGVGLTLFVPDGSGVQVRSMFGLPGNAPMPVLFIARAMQQSIELACKISNVAQEIEAELFEEGAAKA